MDLYNIYINSGVFHTFRNTEDAPNFTSVKTKLKINGTSTGPCHDGYGRSSYQVDAIKRVEDPKSAHKRIHNRKSRTISFLSFF